MQCVLQDHLAEGCVAEKRAGGAREARDGELPDGTWVDDGHAIDHNRESRVAFQLLEHEAEAISIDEFEWHTALSPCRVEPAGVKTAVKAVTCARR